jgi:hypothetical protein
VQIAIILSVSFTLQLATEDKKKTNSQAVKAGVQEKYFHM